MHTATAPKVGPASFAPVIRKLADRGQYGHRRTPRNFSMGESYTEYYWSGAQSYLSFPEWVAAARILSRYHRFVRYVTEVLPEWKEVDRVYYMDNSIEAVQIDRAGNRRQVMVVAPHGDVC